MDEHYRLVFRGEVLDGQHPAVVKRRLTEALNLTEPQLEMLFSGNAVVLKKAADAKTAARYQTLFRKAGGRLRVLPVDAANEIGPATSTQPKQVEPEQGPDTATGTTFTLLPADYQPPPSVAAPEIQAPEFVIAEAGVDLVEHGQAPAVVIPETPFEVAELGVYLLDEPAAQQEVVFPDVEFELAEVGADIGVPRDESPTLPPNVSHLELAEL